MIAWSLSLCREQCWLELTITTDMSCCLKNDNTVSAWSFLTDRTSSDLIGGCSRTQSSVRYSVGWINRTFDTFPLGAALFAIQTNTRLNGYKWAKTLWGGWDRRCACVSLGPPGPWGVSGWWVYFCLSLSGFWDGSTSSTRTRSAVSAKRCCCLHRWRSSVSPASRLVRICTFLHTNAASVWLIKRLQQRRKGQTLVSLQGRTVTDERTANLSKWMHGRQSQVLKFKADSFISGP